MTARAMPEDGQQRRYALTGLLICGGADVRALGERPGGYRCRHGHTSARPSCEGAPRWVYRSAARLVQDLIAANPELAGLVDAGDVAAYLKARDLVVVCGHGTLVVEDAVGEPAAYPVSEAEQAGGIPRGNRCRPSHR
ncbi:hypothetical protein AB0G04_09775 [Actinoplanes sp. NPDC023801]|uniref:hypothetical protein n=1 Tax=Actinoplanes sp. NPDC023801 TaxID=3154595 RepID=UPI0033CD7D69